VVCRKWVHWNEWDGKRVPIILAGDAAHGHFPWGQGPLAPRTPLRLRAHSPTQTTFRRHSRPTRPTALEVLKIQNAARNSAEWFENVERYSAFEAEQFVTASSRSQRISHENLRLRDKGFVAGMESWYSGRAGGPAKAVPPMFTPFTLRSLTLRNRVVVSPMAQYSCRDGTPDDYYLVHLGSRAHGGAALVFTEMVCVASDARISPGCAGLYAPEHVVAWRRIVDYVHAQTDAKIALQLGHAGPKGSTQLGWEGRTSLSRQRTQLSATGR
jgi:anthraniloyl-CoA monooxygenase